MASPPAPHVLILGGHGQVAQLLTPLLLRRAWAVTSLVRAPEQAPDLERLAAGLPGRLRVLVRSLEAVDAQPPRAAAILAEVAPDFVVWTAGAGGSGGPERTFKIDRDVAIHFIRAAAALPSIARFLLVSYTGSRRAAAPWWPAGEWDDYHQSVNHGVLATYYKAKLAADEALYHASRHSPSLVGICLRPGTLTHEPAGRVELGRTAHVKGRVSRASVAHTAAALLQADGVKTCWLDLLDGDDDVDAAVAKAVQSGVDAAEGEAVCDA